MAVGCFVEYGYLTRNQMFILWILLFSSDVSFGMSPVLSCTIAQTAHYRRLIPDRKKRL